MRSDDESETVGNYYDLESFVETPGNHYAFFVSMQYIRLSELVNSKTQAKMQVLATQLPHRTRS